MQAGVRAELAGASGEKQGKIAWQHAVAEGIKPGGIVNQGLDKIGEIQSKYASTLNGGLEKEEQNGIALRAELKKQTASQKTIERAK